MADEVFELEDDYMDIDNEKIRSKISNSKEEKLLGKVDQFEIDCERAEEEEEKQKTLNGNQDSRTANDNNKKDTPKPRTCLTPPENFALVCGKIYRSSFPKEDNFQFLSTLGLKSIICLISEDYPEENKQFLQANNIQFFQIGLSGNKEPFVKIKLNLIEDALKIVLNPENQPILIHCNRGKHRTGCLIGCIRKLQKWSLSMIFDEYRKFSHPKTRPLDQQFVEMFDDDEINEYLQSKNWLPIRW